jgi:tryptophanase
MRKVILSLSIFFMSIAASAQNPYLGLFGKSYILANALTGTEKRISGNIYIIYNRWYCLFYVDGRPSSFFHTRSYTAEPVGEYIHTSFLSGDTNGAGDAYFGVMVDEGKKGKSFQVAIGNVTYFATKAEASSPEGKVPGNVYIKNWKDFEQKMKHADSSNISKAQQEEDRIKELSRIADSTANAGKPNLKMF